MLVTLTFEVDLTDIEDLERDLSLVAPTALVNPMETGPVVRVSGTRRR
jgi:hypothetical protein